MPRFPHHYVQLGTALLQLQVDEVVDNIVWDCEIYHPVHEVEGEEGDGEHDPAVLVDITSLTSNIVVMHLN